LPERDGPVAASRGEPEPGIRARLRRVIEDHSQAAVARRTGTPQPSVSRYLRDRRIPADFCARLVEHLDVSPSWLLAGEGVPYRADLAARSSEEVGSLLDLVTGLNAVQRLHIGAIAKQPPRRALHRLGGEIESFERLRADLGEKMRALFEATIAEADRAIGGSRLEEAESLIQALERVRVLCPDEALGARVDELRAFLESERGNLELAVRIRRQVVRRALLVDDIPAETRLNIDNNFVATLFHTFHLAEAHRMSRVLATLHEERRDLPGYWVLPCSTHIIEAELGELEASLVGLVRVLPRLPELNRSLNRANLVYAQLLAGDATLGEAIAAERVRAAGIGPMPREASARALIRAALIAESPDALAAIIAYARRDLAHSDEKSHVGLARQAEFVLRAVEEPSARLLAEYRDDPRVAEQLASPSARVRFAALVHATQVARLSGERAARGLLEEAERARRALEPGQLPWIALRALHFRSAIALVPARSRAAEPAALRAEAERFFAEHRARRYSLLAAARDAAG